MKRTVIAIACVSALAALGVEAGGPNPSARGTGLQNALGHMSAQGLAHQQATTAQSNNPAARRGPPATTPSGTTPATPATPAVPGRDGNPTTPAVPATPAKPGKPSDDGG